MKLYQVLYAPNDTNGNPRRLTCVYAGPGDPRESCLIEVIDHGYTGDRIPPGSFVLPSIDIAPSEYRSIKLYAQNGSTFCTFTDNN